MFGLALLCMSAAAALWVRPATASRGSSQRPRARGAARRGSRSRRRISFRSWRGFQRGSERDEAAKIGAALTSVAARLRAGQSPTEAWRAAAKQLPSGAGKEMEILADGPAADSGARAERNLSQTSGALHAARAATELDRALGAELGPGPETSAAGTQST